MVWYGKACPAADVAETKQEIGLNQDLTNQTCCFFFLPKSPKKTKYLKMLPPNIMQYFNVVHSPCESFLKVGLQAPLNQWYVCEPSLKTYDLCLWISDMSVSLRLLCLWICVCLSGLMNEMLCTTVQLYVQEAFNDVCINYSHYIFPTAKQVNIWWVGLK